MNDAPIGILDSGFGGLSVYKSIIKLLPNESTIYIGDHAYLPYGEKTKKQIRERTKKLITFLLSKGSKIIVVACNTSTIAGIDQYRRWFPDTPIIGVVPVVKTAAEVSKMKSFAVLSTAFTAKSTYQRQLIKKFALGSRVYNLGCTNLVSFVEHGIVHGKKIDGELKTLLNPILKNIDVVVLGCTHYPFLHDAIRDIVGSSIRILDSGGAVARHVMRIMNNNGITTNSTKGNHFFYTTKKSTGASKVASILLGRNTKVLYAHI